MRYRTRPLIVFVAAGLLTGCQAPEGAGGTVSAGKASAPTTRPSTIAAGRKAPTTKPAPKPLPSKALIALDKLKPDIAKPTAKADSGVPPRAQKAVARARELIKDGKYALVVPLLVERALGFAPNSAEVHRLLSEAYIKLPDAGKALVHMRKAVELNGDSITAQVKLAPLYIAQNQKDQAIVALRTALLCSQSKPDNPLTGEALFRLGRLLDEGGYWTASLDCFEALSNNIERHGRKYASRPVLRNIVLRPQRLLTGRGELLLKLRRPAKAATLLKQAFNRDRTNANLAGLAVEALASSGQFNAAEKFLVDLAGQPSLQRKIPFLAAKTALASGDKSMPMRIWKACRAAKRDSGELAVALARAAEKLDAPDQGSAILRSILDSRPGDVAVTKFVVALYAAQGKGDKVFEVLGKLLRADPARDDIVAGQFANLVRGGIPKDFARKFAGKIASAPKDHRASLHYLTGRLGQFQGDESLPVAQYVKAVDTDPAFLPTYAHLAEIYGKKGDKDKLAGLLKNLEKLPGGQESVASCYARGKVHLAMADPLAAEKVLRKGLQMEGGHVPALEALGDALRLGGRVREAAAHYLTVKRLAPLRKGMSERLFEAYMSMRAFREARKFADEALKKNPENRDAKIMLVRVLVDSGQNEEASKLLDELKARTGDDRRLRLLAIRVDLAGARPVMFKKDFDRAVASLEKLTAPDRPDSDAAFVLARMMMQNGRYARAAELWGKLLKVRDDNIVLRARIGALMASGKYDAAGDAIRKMLATLPNDQVLQDRLFACLQLAGKNDRAAALIKQRLSQATESEKAVALRLKMLNFLQDAKLYDSMQEFMDDWILVDSARAEPLRQLKIQVYVLAEKYPRAVAYADKLLAKSPRNHTIKLLMVDALTKSKAYDKAHALLDKWITEQRKDPEENPVFDQLTVAKTSTQKIAEFQGLKTGAYASAGKFDKANTYVADRLKEDSSNLNVRVELIAALGKAKEYDKALARLDAWTKALTVAATSTKPAATTRPSGGIAEALAWCKETAVRVLVMKKAYDEAITRANRYLKSDPKNLELLRLRSSALNEVKQPEKALEDMRKMYELQPDFSGHWNNLGYQLADLGLELTEAEKLIRRSLTAIGPSSPNYLPPLDSLAWALYKQGKLHDAGKVFLQFIRLSREQKYTHPILFDHAGDGFYRLGWTDRAVELWTRAVKLAAEDETGSREVRQVRRLTPGKIEAVKAGKPARVAPLGKGVKIQDK